MSDQRTDQQGIIGVDVGGTFTDNVSFENGKINVTKVRTNDEHMESSVLEGAEALDVGSKSLFNHASTTGLNAIITRKLPEVAYLTTLGHRDVLDMGRAWRPLEGQTNANWRRPFGDAARPLIPRYLRRGIKERINNDGSVFMPLDEEQAREELEVLKRCDVQGVAICLINAYMNPEHEIWLRELVREVLGDTPCSISSEVSPLAKEYPRASTTVIDVFMKNVFWEYSDNLIGGLKNLGYDASSPSKGLNFADCAATLAPVDFAMQYPFRIIFSGPAAGTVATAHFGESIGEGNFVCCDVGGTSTDISIVTDGAPIVDTIFEVEHDLLVNTLANEIATIGSGGGSIVSVAPSGELQVGPDSAGSDPGPASYPEGGTQPTLTDACLMIGILNEDDFLGGKMKLYRQQAQQAFESLQTDLSLDERVEFAYRLGLNHIGEGIVDITVQNGVDPRDYSIMAYGSAGPMLIPAVMDQVHAKSVIVPPYPGVFSALGLMSTDLVYADSRSAYVLLTEGAAEEINEVYKSMEEGLLGQISRSRDEVTVLRTFDGRYVGQTWETPLVPVPSVKVTGEEIEKMVADFHEAYKERWGNRFDALPVQGVTYRVQVTIPTQKVEYEQLEKGDGHPEPKGKTTLRFMGDGAIEASEFWRKDLRQGDVVEGPALIREEVATTQVVEGQIATIGQYGEIVITRREVS